MVRLGHSFVYSPTTSHTVGNPNAETDFIRLTDGTRLNEIGALSPGVNVSGVDVFFYGIDFAAKSRGWSFDSEVFFRWLENFEADGAVPVNSLMQRGFYVEGGKFIIPQKLDVNFRYSEVSTDRDFNPQLANIWAVTIRPQAPPRRQARKIEGRSIVFL